MHNEACSTKQVMKQKGLSKQLRNKDPILSPGRGRWTFISFIPHFYHDGAPSLVWKTANMLWKTANMLWKIKAFPNSIHFPLQMIPKNGKKLFMHKKSQTVQSSHSWCWKQQHSIPTLIRPLKERERALFCTRGVEGCRPGVWVTDCLLN